MTKSHGKGMPLEDSIEWMEQRLVDLGFDIEEIRWCNPVPHLWSVTIQDKNCTLLNSSGKGITPESAKASALGSFIERLATNHYIADYYLGAEIAQSAFVHHPNEQWFPAASSGWPKGLLDKQCLNHYDPQDAICGDQLIDLNSANESRGICALPFIRQSDGEQVWFPVNLINNLYDSNGMAAGDTPVRAKVQALSEVFERHIKMTIIANGIALPRIPARVLADHPRVETAIKALRVKGFVVDVRDASLGGRYPLVAITLFDRNHTGALCSFGAHPKFATALERALTALLEGRDVDQLTNLPPLTFDLSKAAKSANLTQHALTANGVLPWDIYSDVPDYPLTEWNIEGEPEDEFADLCSRVHQVDLDIYVAQYDHLGIPVCRLLVPGMSEVRPVDQLITRNNNLVIPMRPLIMAAQHLDEDDLLALLEELDAVELDDDLPLAQFLGLVPEASPEIHLYVAELKLMLALALGETELLPSLIKHVMRLPTIDSQRAGYYQLLDALVTIQLDPNRKQSSFERPLSAVYGEDLYQKAKHALRGESVLEPFTDLLDKLIRSTQYQQVIEVYIRLKEAVTSVTQDTKDNKNT